MTTAPTKIRVNVYVTPEQKEMFDLEAKRLGKTRSVLIADAASRYIESPTPTNGLPVGRYVVNDCVNDIARRYSGIPRTQLVGMVAAVIRKLAAM
jgi:hypothetical protein|tara:strand:- start:1345 stop:1629 length:285 start_codon:yes stop_codon:yes gene_type:complete